MPGIDRDQLETLKRQLEEDFRLDMAAIERLQSRFRNGAEETPAREHSPSIAAVRDVPFTETRVAPAPRVEPVPQPAPQRDEMEGTLRSMFSSARR